jgi:hypothetical protein
MKKSHLIAIAAALLLSGGVFMKVNNTNDSLLDENIEAFTEDPEQGSGTCGYIVYFGDGPYDYFKDCNLPYEAAYGTYSRYSSYQYRANWCCDSCKNTGYCGS